MIIVQIVEIGIWSGDLIGYFSDDHARGGEQFPPQHLCRLHVQHLMQLFTGHKLRYHNGNCLVGLSAGENFVNVAQQWFQEEAVWRIQDYEARPSSPGLPLFANFFRVLRFSRDMNSSDVVR
jgi:hypothetical protein